MRILCPRGIPLLWVLIYFGTSGCTPQPQPESKVVEKKITLNGTLNKEPVLEKKMTLNKTPDEKGEHGRRITAEIISKSFVSKNGKLSSHVEFYVRRSIQDYFIKFCESKVSKDDIKERLEKNGSQMLSLEIEIKNGEWDKCRDNPVQSRTGDYIIIHKISE